MSKLDELKQAFNAISDLTGNWHDLDEDVMAQLTDAFERMPSSEWVELIARAKLAAAAKRSFNQQVGDLLWIASKVAVVVA